MCLYAYLCMFKENLPKKLLSVVEGNMYNIKLLPWVRNTFFMSRIPNLNLGIDFFTIFSWLLDSLFCKYWRSREIS